MAFDDVPILPREIGAAVECSDNPEPSINFDRMKKADRIRRAQNMAQEGSKPEIKFDSRQINLQRALDYTTGQSNSVVFPKF